MNDKERILEALQRVLDEEQKAINHLILHPHQKTNAEKYKKMKQRIFKGLIDAESIIRLIVSREIMKTAKKIRQTSSGNSRFPQH